MEEICDDMHQFYLKKMVPFLACLGVIATGSEKYQWTWTEEVNFNLFNFYYSNINICTESNKHKNRDDEAVCGSNVREHVQESDG